MLKQYILSFIVFAISAVFHLHEFLEVPLSEAGLISKPFCVALLILAYSMCDRPYIEHPISFLSQELSDEFSSAILSQIDGKSLL